MPRFVRLSTFFAWAIAAGICGVGILLSAFYLYLAPQLPDASQLKTTQLQTPMRIFTSDNKKIAEFGEKRRTPVDIKDIPIQLSSAFIAAEDNRFYQHGGIDVVGLARAAAQLIQAGRIQTGGSTITMQVAKNFFLTRERTFIRKFNEIFLAIQIEQVLSKPEILGLYLNKIYLGNRAYGVKAAAQVYYGKDLDQLSLAESAMIAGLPKAPSRFNPIVNPERAKIRRDWILDRMLQLNMISEQEHLQARLSELTAGYHAVKSDLAAPYVAEMARQKAIELFGAEAYTAGLRVFVTTNSELQNQAQQAMKAGLEAYDIRHGYRGPLDSVDINAFNDDVAKKQMLRSYLSRSAFDPALIESFNERRPQILLADGRRGELDEASLERAAPYLSVNSIGEAPESFDEAFEAGQIIEVQLVETPTSQESVPTEIKDPASQEDIEAPKSFTFTLKQTPQAQGALISLRPEDGAILALSGGYDFNLSKYNRATQAKRQPGSNFKAFIYLAALEQGNTAATLINDAPLVFEDKNLETEWRPENSSGRFYGPTRLRVAFYNSRNLVSIRLLKAMGIKRTIEHIEKFGFSSEELPKDLSLALGSAGITPLDVAAGYAMIANGGYYIEPYLVDRIEDSQGNILYQAEPLRVCDDLCKAERIATMASGATQDIQPASARDTQEEIEENDQIAMELHDLEALTKLDAPRIADERSIFILHSMMKDVIKRGTGRRALVLERSDIGGKTGTTNDQKDAWFSGFNTDVATSVWVGFDEPKTLGRREYGSRAALPIWIDYMRFALQGKPAANLPQPQGIVSVKIDAESGKRTTSSTNSIFEFFKRENIPEEERSSLPLSIEQETQPSAPALSRPEDIF